MKARKINALIWAIIGLILSVTVAVEWHKQGCGVGSLIMAILFYNSFALCFGVQVDDYIKRKSK